MSITRMPLKSFSVALALALVSLLGLTAKAQGTSQSVASHIEQQFMPLLNEQGYLFMVGRTPDGARCAFYLERFVSADPGGAKWQMTVGVGAIERGQDENGHAFFRPGSPSATLNIGNWIRVPYTPGFDDTVETAAAQGHLQILKGNQQPEPNELSLRPVAITIERNGEEISKVLGVRNLDLQNKAHDMVICLFAQPNS